MEGDKDSTNMLTLKRPSTQNMMAKRFYQQSSIQKTKIENITPEKQKIVVINLQDDQ